MAAKTSSRDLTAVPLTATNLSRTFNFPFEGFLGSTNDTCAVGFRS